MSTNETPQTQPPKRRRLRGFLYASALLVGGGLIGALVASPTRVLGWHDHYGWSRDDGPRWSDHGPRGWSERRAERREHQAIFPGRIERIVDRALDRVDASSEQRQKITRIAERTADEIFALREKHLDARKQLREVLAAQTVDRARLETLRAEQMQLADATSKRITEAVAEAAEVLNPAQRAELSRQIERWQRWRRG